MKKLNASVLHPWENKESQLQEPILSIVVGVTSSRAKLRVSVLLNTIAEYHTRYLIAENEITDAVQEADLIIGSGDIARNGILYRKPVIVVGEYGCGGLVTPNTLHSQCDNCFKGRINGMKDEYFSLAGLEGEIKRSADLTFQELQMMSNQMVTFLHNINF